MTTLTESRSALVPENIQELIDADVSVANALNPRAGYGQQYKSPEWLARHCWEKMYGDIEKGPSSVLDPQCANGALIDYGAWTTHKYGWELDNRISKADSKSDEFVHGNCVRIFELLYDLHPDIMFEAIHSNPPFGKRWKVNEIGSPTVSVDSTEWTWNYMTRFSNQGFLISNATTIERLGYHKNAWVFDYETHENVWKDCKVKIGIVFWRRPKSERVDPTPDHYFNGWFAEAQEILDEERKGYPKFNIFMGSNGLLKTYLSTFHKLKFKVSRHDIERVGSINGAHPLSLVIDKESRDALRKLVDCGTYLLQPEAEKAIKDALETSKTMAVPLLPVTDFEAVAYADEEEQLVCKKNMHALNASGSSFKAFTAGKSYQIKAKTYEFIDSFKCMKAHYDATTDCTTSKEHEMQLSGTDRCIEIRDDFTNLQRFMDRPRKGQPNERSEAMLWEYFEQPKVPTIMDTHAAEIARNLKRMEDFEFFSDFQYYPGQREYVARIACKDYGMVAAATGVGKSMLALTLIQLKAPKRALIIAPQATVRGGDSDDDEDGEDEAGMSASQWASEIRKFTTGLAVFELFGMDDYNRIRKLNKGVLPPGIYITYYETWIRGGKAIEVAPQKWTDEDFIEACAEAMDCDPSDLPTLEYPTGLDEKEAESFHARTVGRSMNGIRCIITPSMSELIGDQFDGVFADEVHRICNLSTITAQTFIRLQPKYRFGFSATPIPNTCSGLFPIMGWITTPGWHQGNIRTPAWPYAVHEQARFDKTFLCSQRDLTAEHAKRKADPRWRGKVEKISPIISAPARLLKILKPTMGYISKEQCNPSYKPGKIIDVRVEMGHEQSKLYGHFMSRGNVPCSHPLIAARKQMAYLRAICADPAGFKHHTLHSPRVSSDFNPKTIAIMQLFLQFMERGEQALFVSARKGQTSFIAKLLTECGIEYGRIDSTVSAADHSEQSNLFKKRKVPLMLMGMRCAVGHSYDHCPNEVISSIEWSCGTLNQARGRVDRVNSKAPPTIYCILHSNSIEEQQFNTVAIKEDASQIVLQGRRVPRDFHPVEASELLAKSMEAFTSVKTVEESELAAKWPALRSSLRAVKWRA